MVDIIDTAHELKHESFIGERYQNQTITHTKIFLNFGKLYVYMVIHD